MFNERLQKRNIVPFRHLPDGLYLMKQPSRFPVIEHYGILVTGRFLREIGIYNSEPIIIHQTHPNIKVEQATTTGSWNLVRPVHPRSIPFAMERIRVALCNPGYDLLLNNCEQVARFIAEGEKYSTQVRWGGLLLAVIILANRNNK